MWCYNSYELYCIVYCAVFMLKISGFWKIFLSLFFFSFFVSLPFFFIKSEEKLKTKKGKGMRKELRARKKEKEKKRESDFLFFRKERRNGYKFHFLISCNSFWVGEEWCVKTKGRSLRMGFRKKKLERERKMSESEKESRKWMSNEMNRWPKIRWKKEKERKKEGER